jgi:cell pole-organizing protein PopZ
MGHDNEASVEEILESIKKVIARDNRAVALENRRRRDVAPERPVEITPMPTPEAPHAHHVRDEDEVLDLSDMEFVSETGVPALPLANDDETPLIDDTVRSAMQDNLAALAMLAEPGAKPQIVRSGETSLEGLTRELLRPMLAEWLEANLPAMVEQMVQAEIARIVGKKV